MTARPHLAPRLVLLTLLVAVVGIVLAATTPAQAAPAKCMGKKATIVGTNKADRIVGTPRRDVIVARGGNDKIFGRGGNDLICAGGGKDVVAGGAGRDTIAGGSGNDRLTGGAGGDTITGNAGNDRLGGGAGNDKLNGGAGSDRLSGSAGKDRLVGGKGNDVLGGGKGNDVLAGSAGRDIAVGGPGRDACAAERTRTCETGATDTTTPGPSSNRILVSTKSDSGAGGIFSMDSSGADVKRLHSKAAIHVRVSPDGERLVWQEGTSIVVAKADGKGAQVVAAPKAGSEYRSPDWSSDGKRLIFGEIGPDKKVGLRLLTLANGKIAPWRTADTSDWVSPDYVLGRIDWEREFVSVEYALPVFINCIFLGCNGEDADPFLTALMPTDTTKGAFLLGGKAGESRLAPFTVKDGNTIRRPIAFSKSYGFDALNPNSPAPAGARVAFLGGEYNPLIPGQEPTRKFQSPAFNPDRKGIAFFGGPWGTENPDKKVYVLNAVYTASGVQPTSTVSAPIWSPPAGTEISSVDWANIAE